MKLSEKLHNEIPSRQGTMKRKSLSTDHDEKKKKKKKKPAHSIGESSKPLCGICLDYKTDSDIFRRGKKCKHPPFCVDCICKHVFAQINNKNVVNLTCPNPYCTVKLKPKHLQHVLPKEVIDHWESARFEGSIAQGEKTYCPFKDCSVLLVSDEGEVVTSSECPSCHKLFCAQCKVPWHAEMNCQEFQKLGKKDEEKDSDTKFLEMAERKRWQRCPKCSIYVKRSSGCDRIPCRCGCNFCYRCGKKWKSYAHRCQRPLST